MRLPLSPYWPPGVPPTLEVPDRNLYRHLAANAQRVPERTAIAYYGRALGYGELHDCVLRLAGYLQQHLGVAGGDRVALLMQNCPQFVIAYFAILRCNAVVVAISPMSTVDEVTYYVGDAGVRVLVTTQELMPAAGRLLDDGALDGCIVGASADFAGPSDAAPWLVRPAFVAEPRAIPAGWRIHDFQDALAAGIAPGPLVGGGPDLAALAYTSGTTGKPKGAMLSHRALAHSIVARVRWVDDDEHLTELLALPLSHQAGAMIMHMAMLVGRTVHLLARWDAGNALSIIERERIGTLALVTPMMIEFMAHPAQRSADLSSVRRLFCGATATPAAVSDAIEARLGLRYLESYGMTESGGGTHVNPPQAPRRQCAGIPYINVDARVIDPVTLEELGPDTEGEIVMCAPTLFDGYWNRPEATRETFLEIDGKRFVRSGDIGHYDADGYFYVTDRLKRMINASGLKVWPAEIESWLHDHPDVMEAAVVSARDARRGETVKAFVVPRPSARGTLTPDALIAWARTRMSAYKVPRLVEFVDALPRTSSGKVLWRTLQADQDARDRAQAASGEAA